MYQIFGRLNSLQLQATCLPNNFFKEFEKFTKFKQLSLLGNQVDNFHSDLSPFTNLSNLEIFEFIFDDSNQNIKTEFNAAKLTNLTKLSLCNRRWIEADFDKLLHSETTINIQVPSLTSVHCNSLSSLDAVNKCSGLKILGVESLNACVNGKLANFQFMTSLILPSMHREKVYLPKKEVQEDLVSSISCLENLIYLHGSFPDVENKLFSKWESCKKVLYLKIPFCTNLGDAVKSFSKNIKMLSVSYSNLSDDDLRYIEENFPDLFRIRVDGTQVSLIQMQDFLSKKISSLCTDACEFTEEFTKLLVDEYNYSLKVYAEKSKCFCYVNFQHTTDLLKTIYFLEMEHQKC